MQVSKALKKLREKKDKLYNEVIIIAATKDYDRQFAGAKAKEVMACICALVSTGGSGLVSGG